MLTLHYGPGKASLTPHILLNEIGTPFELALVDTAAKAHESAEYLRLNPNGKIPTLVDDGLVLWETAAIVLHLVDSFPAAKLAPPVGTKDRAHFYRWIAHLSNTIQPEMRPYFYPEQHVEDPAHAPDVKLTAERRLREMYKLVDRLLGDVGPYLLGNEYSAADPYLFMLVRWGRGMMRPPRLLPNLARHAALMLERPAVKRAFEREGLQEPFI